MRKKSISVGERQSDPRDVTLKDAEHHAHQKEQPQPSQQGAIRHAGGTQHQRQQPPAHRNAERIPRSVPEEELNSNQTHPVVQRNGLYFHAGEG